MAVAVVLLLVLIAFGRTGRDEAIQIVYSTQPGLAGTSVRPDAEMRRALRTHTTQSKVGDPKRPGNRLDDGTRLLDVQEPIETAAGRTQPRLRPARRAAAGRASRPRDDAEPEELLRAVRSAAAGDAPLDPRAAREVLAARRDRDAIVELTERERQILSLVAGGHANKVIALRLGISHKTVRNTLSAACRKIGVSDRTQAALWAQRAGLTATR